ncbi:hypothetical protein SALBM135S_08522 [Streptomyces alboniger]
MDYPLLNVFLTMLWFFLWVMWLVLLFRIIGDIFRSADFGGWAKTGWLLCVIVLPFLGVFLYVIVRGKSMGERDVRIAKERDMAFRKYVQDASGGSSRSGAEQLAQLAELRRSGQLTETEFQQAKSKVLAP